MEGELYRATDTPLEVASCATIKVAKIRASGIDAAETFELVQCETFPIVALENLVFCPNLNLLKALNLE